MTRTTDPDVTASKKTQAAQDLSAILDLATHLAAQAINDANDQLMPGGLAMVALADVANLEAWDHLGGGDDTAELWEPPLQTLLRWSEEWRRIHNRETDRRPTLSSEVGFIRRTLDWAETNDPRFDAFATDVHDARRRLEDLLHDGDRDKHGVPCLSCGRNLVRYTRERRHVRVTSPADCVGAHGICRWPHTYCVAHDRGGLADEWRCPGCNRRYSPEDYVRAVQQVHVAFGEYLPIEDAVARTGATRGSIQGWASKAQVAKRKHVLSGRMTYRVSDIEARLRAATREATEGLA